MKADKIIAGLLVMLGFAACKPGNEEPPRDDTMYGVPYSKFEQKPRAPDAGAVELRVAEPQKQGNENE